MEFTGLRSRKGYGVTVLTLVCTFIYLFPLYWLVITSIKPVDELFASPPHYFPVHPTLEPYIYNFTAKNPIFPYIVNSLIVAVGTSLLTLVLAAPAAYALARFPLRGKAMIMIILLATQMLPNIMLAMPLFIIFSKLELINNYFALILANTTHSLPFAILVLRPSFLALPAGLEEAALMDGTTRVGAFLRIMLPLARPGLLTVGAISFLWGWGDFIFALTLTTTESIRPLTLGLTKFTAEYGTQWNYLMAAATIAAIPIILIFISLQKYIVSGLTNGSMKE